MKEYSPVQPIVVSRLVGTVAKVERSRKRGFEEVSADTGEKVAGREFEKRKKVLQDGKMKKRNRGGNG
jgi:hypothetical protein